MLSILKKVLLPLLLLSLAFMLYVRHAGHDQADQGGGIAWQDRVVMWMVAPFGRLTDFTHARLSHMSDYVTTLSKTVAENDSLHAELDQLRLKNMELGQVNQEVERLRSLFQFQTTFPKKLVAARVISLPPLSEFRIVMIDKGTEEGVRKRAAVLVPQGLVGQVVRVTSHTAEILLITDPTSAVDARIVRSEARGIVVGKSISIGLKRDLYIGSVEYLSRLSDVVTGDQVVSTGLDGVFPAGIPIGTIQNVSKGEYGLFQDADLLPLVSLEKLHEVLVVSSP